MEKQIGINIIIEREKQGSETIFVASSLDVNVFAEGKSIGEVREKFIEGLKHHLETFPEERELLILKEKEEFEMPIIQKFFIS